MKRSAKLLQEIQSGDLLFIALSKQLANEWIDLALVCGSEVLRTIHLSNGESKVISQSLAEYLEQEQRPVGVFRLYNVPTEAYQALPVSMLQLLNRPQTLWDKLCSLFRKSVPELDWYNQKSIKLLVLEHFRQESIKRLETEGRYVRLM